MSLLTTELARAIVGERRHELPAPHAPRSRRRRLRTCLARTTRGRALLNRRPRLAPTD